MARVSCDGGSVWSSRCALGWDMSIQMEAVEHRYETHWDVVSSPGAAALYVADLRRLTASMAVSRIIMCRRVAVAYVIVGHHRRSSRRAARRRSCPATTLLMVRRVSRGRRSRESSPGQYGGWMRCGSSTSTRQGPRVRWGGVGVPLLVTQKLPGGTPQVGQYPSPINASRAEWKTGILARRSVWKKPSCNLPPPGRRQYTPGAASHVAQYTKRGFRHAKKWY